MIRNLIVASLFFVLASEVRADFTYFNWAQAEATTGTGNAAEFSATYAMLPTANLATYTSDDTTYVKRFGATMPGFEISKDSSVSGTFNFSGPLRKGSIMVILDIDAGEKISFTSNTKLTFIKNIERKIGAKSTFPTWSNSEQSITALPVAALQP